MKVCGFIGGCGGHLHNFGVVLLRDEQIVIPAIVVEPENGSLYKEKLLKLCEFVGLCNCGMLTVILYYLYITELIHYLERRSL